MPLWKDVATLLKLHAQLTYKQNEKQYYKQCFTAGLKSALNLLIKIITNRKQPSSEDTCFPGLFFTKSKSKQQVCYLKTSSTSFYNNAYKNSLNSDAKSILFALNNLQRDSTPQFTQCHKWSKSWDDMDNYLNFLNFHGRY